MKKFKSFITEGKITEITPGKLNNLKEISADVVFVFPHALQAETEKIKTNFLRPFVMGRRMPGSIGMVEITENVKAKMKDIKGFVKDFKNQGTDAVVLAALKLDNNILSDIDDDTLAQYNIDIHEAARKSGADYMVFFTV